MAHGDRHSTDDGNETGKQAGGHPKNLGWKMTQCRKLAALQPIEQWAPADFL
jgi:hypothetical protein